MANLSAVLHATEEIRIEDRPVPEISDGQIAISMRSVGICGSDIYLYKNMSHGTHAIASGLRIGHEASGVVTKLGPGVTKFKIGDRVVLEPGNACNQCKNCYRGVQNMCLVEQPYNGGGEGEGYITQTKVMHESYCHRIPASMTFEEGAFMEPLAVAVHDCRRGEVATGKSVLVLGAGTIGLLCMMTAKAMGVTNICITDVVEDRLKLAKDLGATHTYLSKSRDLEVATKEIHELMGEAPDVTIECTGNNLCQRLSIQVTIPSGTVVIVGYGDPEATLPLALAAQRQITLRPAWRYDRQCYGIAIDLVSSGKVNVAALVTHRFTLQQTDEALKKAASRGSGVLKVMVNCDVTE